MPFEDRLDELTGEQRELFERFLRNERLTIGAANTYRAPSNSTEVALAKIWTDLLGAEPGVHDNYFELGGDSIAIIRMVAAARSTGIPLETAWVFAQPTIAGLAALSRLVEPASPSVAIASPWKDVVASIRAADPEFDHLLQQQRATPVDAYPLSPSQQGMLFHALDGATEQSYIVQWTFRLSGPFDRQRFESAWARVIERHDVFRTMFQWIGVDEPLQVVLDRAEMDIVEDDAGDDWRTRAQAIAAEERRRGFDLRHPPLMRTRFLRISADEQFCILTHHHLILDAWSQQVVLRDLFAAYRGLPLPAGRHGAFRDHVYSLRSRDQAPAAAFWRRWLDGYRPAPTAHRPALDTQSSLVRSVAQTAALREALRRLGVTVSVFYQAVWALALARLGAHTDVAFGLTCSGRSSGAAGIDEAVGMFINTLPLRIRVDARMTLHALLEAVKHSTMALVEHEWCGLAAVQNWIGWDRRTPLVDCAYVYERFPVDMSELERTEGLTVHDLRAITAEHYPLVFIVQDDDDTTTLTVKHTFGDVETIRRLSDLLEFMGSVAGKFVDTPGVALHELLDVPAVRANDEAVDGQLDTHSAA